LYKEILEDIRSTNTHWALAVFGNRGFHALFIYRISNWLWKMKVPLIPLILTRIIQILYAIDIDWRARISGGVTIIHGVGLVIGSNASVKKGCTLYHGVTLGISNSKNDGFPQVDEDVLIGAGAKILGQVHLGRGCRIGANAVVVKDVPEYATAVGIPAKIYPKNRMM